MTSAHLLFPVRRIRLLRYSSGRLRNGYDVVDTEIVFDNGGVAHIIKNPYYYPPTSCFLEKIFCKTAFMCHPWRGSKL